jgi:hypothetical protein
MQLSANRISCIKYRNNQTFKTINQLTNYHYHGVILLGHYLNPLFHHQYPFSYTIFVTPMLLTHGFQNSSTPLSYNHPLQSPLVIPHVSLKPCTPERIR